MNSDILRSENNKLYSTFHFYITLLRLGAIRFKILSEPKGYRIYEVVQISSYYLVNIGILVNTFQNMQDFTNTINAIRLILTMVVISWIQVSFRYSIESLERLMFLTTSYTWDDQPKIDPGTGDATMTSLIIKIKKFVKYSVVAVWIFHGTNAVIKMSTKPNMIFRTWYPFNEYYMSTFVIINTLQIIASIPTICTFFGFLGVYGTFVTIACSQLEKLRSNLLAIRQKTPYKSIPERDFNDIKQRLEDCIRHHQSILEFCQMLEESMNLTLWGLFLIILTTMCFSAFGAVTVWGNVADLSDCVVTYIAMLGNVATICWFGNQLTDKVESVREACLRVDWIGAPVPVQRCIIFMMARANQKFTLTAGKFVPVTNETLMNMVNQSVSFFMFLLQVKDNNSIP